MSLLGDVGARRPRVARASNGNYAVDRLLRKSGVPPARPLFQKRLLRRGLLGSRLEDRAPGQRSHIVVAAGARNSVQQKRSLNCIRVQASRSSNGVYLSLACIARVPSLPFALIMRASVGHRQRTKDRPRTCREYYASAKRSPYLFNSDIGRLRGAHGS